jgi:tripartite-type tricarboxylate transporter receptor subunit TctC
VRVSQSRGLIRKHGRRLRSALVLSIAVLPLAACGGTGGGASGGDWEPENDITWMVPYSPGGGFDTYSRGIAQVMQKNHLPEGINVGVENVTPLPQGITSLYEAKSDGYEIGMLPMPATAVQELQNPEVAPWETAKFTVLGQVDANDYVVYVPANSKFKTIDDLVKAKGLKALTVEQGSSSALATQSVIQEFGLDANLTYGAEGSQEVVTAAMRGDVDFFVYGASDVTGFVESGDVRPLLFLGQEADRPKDAEWLQDVPGVEETDHPGIAGVVTERRIIAGPPDLPDEVADYLRKALSETMKDPEFTEWAAEADRPIVPLNAEEASEAMRKQTEKMQQLLPKLK